MFFSTFFYSSYDIVQHQLAPFGSFSIASLTIADVSKVSLDSVCAVVSIKMLVFSLSFSGSLVKMSLHISRKGWKIHSQWLENTFTMVGKYIHNGWKIHSQWLENTFTMAGKYITNGWKIHNQWLENTFTMA